MNKNKKNKLLTGFTIIELLVVIAIIGVLAAIVLVNVTRYIDKGKDAAAKGDMATLFTNAITFYNENSDFNGVKSDDDYEKAVQSITNEEKMNYNLVDTCTTSTDCTDEEDQSWCAAIDLKANSGTAFCVDSSGNKEEFTGEAGDVCVAGECQ